MNIESTDAQRGWTFSFPCRFGDVLFLNRLCFDHCLWYFPSRLLFDVLATCMAACEASCPERPRAHHDRPFHFPQFSCSADMLWMLPPFCPISRRRCSELGGNVRTGLEDTFYLPDGKRASTSGQLIEALVKTVRETGREPATIAETRQMLGLRPV